MKTRASLIALAAGLLLTPALQAQTETPITLAELNRAQGTVVKTERKEVGKYKGIRVAVLRAQAVNNSARAAGLLLTLTGLPSLEQTEVQLDAADATALVQALAYLQTTTLPSRPETKTMVQFTAGGCLLAAHYVPPVSNPSAGRWTTTLTAGSVSRTLDLEDVAALEVILAAAEKKLR